jgi:hypothetical protein
VIACYPPTIDVNSDFTQNHTRHFPALRSFSCPTVSQFGGGGVASLDQGAPAASQSFRNSACDFFASSCPNSVPQEGQISNEAHPALSYGGSASSAKPQTGQVCVIRESIR